MFNRVKFVWLSNSMHCGTTALFGMLESLFGRVLAFRPEGH